MMDILGDDLFIFLVLVKMMILDSYERVLNEKKER